MWYNFQKYIILAVQIVKYNFKMVKNTPILPWNQKYNTELWMPSLPIIYHIPVIWVSFLNHFFHPYSLVVHPNVIYIT
jgi:hypothetical protein